MSVLRQTNCTSIELEFCWCIEAALKLTKFLPLTPEGKSLSIADQIKHLPFPGIDRTSEEKDAHNIELTSHICNKNIIFDIYLS